MSHQWPGGLIRKTPPTPAGPYQDGAAPGVWTLDQATYWLKQGLWPIAGNVETDPYFEYVTMLLPGNGTNGAQNNTFLDSSTNNFTITRNGNTTQGTFSPYGTLWSNYFDGSGDWLSVFSQTALGMGAGDFTYEAWIFVNETVPTNALRGLFDSRVGGATGCGIYTSADSGTTAKLVYATNSAIAASSSSQIPSFTWAHIAVTRSGTTVRGFINGNLEFTVTDSRTFSSSAGTDIGRDITPAYFNGYISNARILKGTAQYTAAFTPPTSPLTAITNTSLLTCQSNRFIDNSTNAFAITVNGNTSVQRFSPFNPTAPYAAGTDGGSGYFDGSGDYLNTAYNAAFSLGTGAFTVEAWVYLTAAPPATAGIITLGTGASGSSAYSAWSIFVSPSLIPSFYRYDGTEYNYSSSTALTLNAWNHIAVVRDGSSNFAIFLNGTRVYSATVSQTFANVNTNDLYIARFASGGGVTPYYPTGYITDCRVIKGSAQYSPTSTTLTVPTAPLTAITNTQLLTNFTNAGIIDNAEMNDLETVGNAQISTAQSKFGGGSMYFDGSGDAVTAPPNVNLAMGTGDFTIEMWVYGANSGGTVGGAYPRIFQLGAAQTVNTIECYNAAGTMYVEMLGTGFSFTASTLLNSTWNHFAVTRAGTSLRAFVNGTQVASTTSSNNLTSPITNASFIGASTASSGNFSGYIDDLRITKGYARYTANFTAPTKAFPLF